ncbi:hypothetical protein JCM6882_007660 [Rhodosporidiobolus microsporus]
MSYSIALSPSAAAFHPKLVLSLSNSSSPSSSYPSSSQCSLWLLLPIPPSLILDRYELHRLHSLPSSSSSRLGAFDAASGGKSSLMVVGEGDLEAPVWRVEEREPFRGRGGVLLRLLDGADKKGKGKERRATDNLDVEIPLHVRYPRPVPERYEVDPVTGEKKRVDSVEVEVEAPWVFWGCDEPDPTLAALFPSCPPPPLSPPSSLPLPLNFPSLSPLSLYFLPTSSPSSPALPCPPPRPSNLTLQVPTGVMADLPLVEAVTMLVVWVCAGWVGWGAWKAFRRAGRGDERARAGGKGKGIGRKEGKEE